MLNIFQTPTYISSKFSFQIFQLLEFPDEKNRMTTLQELTMLQRENFLKLVFNLTSDLNDDEIEALRYDHYSLTPFFKGLPTFHKSLLQRS